MSQSHDSKDTQALLQSMLQRLKLQPGKEAQAYLHTPLPTTPAWGQIGKRGASNLQKVNSGPVNGFEPGTNGISPKELGISAAGSNFGFRGGEIQQPGRGLEVDRGLISSTSQKDNIDGDTGEERVLGQSTQPGITPTGTGQPFPAESLKDADITSFERTRWSSGGSAMTRQIRSNNVDTGLNQDQDQSFTPKVFMWSLKPKEANLDTQVQENEALHMGNGGFGALAMNKDMQVVAANSGSRRKQRSSENKTRRWTQKIKERWRDRPGSFGNKGKKEGGTVDQKSELGLEISPPNQLMTAGNVINTSKKEEERTLPVLDSSGPSNTTPTNSEDGTNEGYMRSTSDFEFGLGSFSLLEEIVTGQEWARFLNPNQSAASAHQRPSELKITPNLNDTSPSSLILSQQGVVNNQWGFKGTETSPDLDFSRAQISPDAFQPVSMDVSEGKQAAVRGVHSEADQSEPMEHGLTRRPRSFLETKVMLENSALKSRVALNRKRQHHLAYRDDTLHTERMSDGKEADREGFMSSPSTTSNHVMEETGESQRDNSIPLYILNSPSLSPSTPLAPAPRGVLKHSISRDSQSSMETVTKRRRVEENRRVHFSETVVAIAPPEMESYATDSEDDSEDEEDSLAERECEEEQAAIEEVAAPARRPALPAWIQALKRRNTRRKHR
ncbi:uncharacterized protein zgc:113229 [Anoplopoma fimbria]|uniref:uncharacterized protein zgc:113229 n=1 Tax=Anoplopoma fimbria TaxID=229290 RepID=UPI0023EB8179|nr:uncharacterized protein zgc:113229 [Anoplopoma fimbria]XP_054453189.1 uncharacterized protein zgc:113229 [Anoplopoma fimbria]